MAKKLIQNPLGWPEDERRAAKCDRSRLRFVWSWVSGWLPAPRSRAAAQFVRQHLPWGAGVEHKL